MPSATSRFWLVTAGGVIAAIWLALVWRFWFLCDDAFISFRYAHNLAEGLGLTYHALDLPPVEGYSNLLWVLWLGLGDWLRLAPEHLAPATSAATGIVIVVDVGRCLDRLGVNRAATFCALLWLVCMPPFTVWCTGGLETMPATLCGWLAFRSLFGPAPHRPWTAALAVLGLSLLRPEGPAFVVVLLGLAALCRTREPTAVAPWRTLALVAAVAGAAFAAQVAFRLATYEEWLPNTARAKGEFTWFRAERGLCYVTSFVLTFPGTGVALAIAVVMAMVRRSAHGAMMVGALGLAIAQAAFAIRVGGDFMAMGRFLVPAVPMLALGLGLGLDALLRMGRPLLATLLVAGACTVDLLPAFDLHAVPARVRESCDFRWGLPRPTTEFAAWRDLRDGVFADLVLARALNRHTRPGEQLIREAIGVIGYHTHLRILDTWGLVTVRPEADHTWLPVGTPGHDRFLAWPVFLDQRPDYMNAQLVAPDEPVSCPMLWTPFLVSPLAQRVEVLHFPIDEPDAHGRTVELRVLRFRAWDDPTAPMTPLIAATAEIDPGDPAAAQRLSQRLTARGAEQAAFALREAASGNMLLPHGTGPLRYGHVADPTSRSHGFWIDAVSQAGTGLRTGLPRGKLVYAVALEGSPRINGHEPGWIVVPPAASYQDVVDGGTALLVQFVPGGVMFPGQ